MYDKGKKQDATPAAESETADLRTKSLELLDFPAIRERVATHTTLPLARDFALQLTPSHIAEDVDVLQRETAEGLVFLDEVGNLGLHTAEDVSSAIDRAALDGSLSGHELLAVAASLEAQRRARSALLGVRGSVPLLADIAEGIPDLGDIQQRIGACIGDRGEVLDQATPTLGKLRHHVRTAYKRVTEAQERIFHSSAGQEALQDQVVSMRGERLVLQVKTELRHRIPGVVLDASNTGATLFTEPFATVDLCNAWTELVLEEAREVSKVLRDLSLLVGASADDIRRGTQLAAQLDFIMARSGYSQTLKGTAVPSRAGAVRRSQKDQPAGVRLIGARHPLLGQDAVPININIGPGWSALLITGPNTGGKTAAMKTVGMLALMHQSGLYIPADEGSSLPVFDGIYADVGDQQSIEQSVSTFGLTHPQRH